MLYVIILYVICSKRISWNQINLIILILWRVEKNTTANRKKYMRDKREPRECTISNHANFWASIIIRRRIYGRHFKTHEWNDLWEINDHMSKLCTQNKYQTLISLTQPIILMTHEKSMIIRNFEHTNECRITRMDATRNHRTLVNTMSRKTKNKKVEGEVLNEAVGWLELVPVEKGHIKL